MAHHFIVPEDIENYALARSENFPEINYELARRTYEEVEMPQMLSGELGGGVLRMVARLIGARRVLEVGMYTGFGTLALAEAVPEGGEVHTLELEQQHVDFAIPFFEASGHSDKITIHIGPALESIRRLEPEFDLVFLDADKVNYGHYYEEALRLLRPGGVVLIDNVLWSGRVLDPQSDSDRAIDALNRKIETDERVDRLMLTVRDGIFLVRKRG